METDVSPMSLSLLPVTAHFHTDSSHFLTHVIGRDGILLQHPAVQSVYIPVHCFMLLHCQARPGCVHLPGHWLKVQGYVGIRQDGVQWNVHPPGTLFQGQLCQQQSKVESIYPFSFPTFSCTHGPGGGVGGC